MTQKELGEPLGQGSRAEAHKLLLGPMSEITREHSYNEDQTKTKLMLHVAETTQSQSKRDIRGHSLNPSSHK